MSARSSDVLTATSSRAGSSLDLWVSLPILAALAGYCLFLFGLQPLKDSDSLWQVAAGQWILSHGAVPHVDPFSYTFAGAAWDAQEWLSEVFIGLAYRAAGWDGVLMLCGAAAALTFAMMAIHLSRWTSGLCLVLMLMLAIDCTSGSLLARPHVLALPALELWTAGLVIARSRNRGPSPWLLPVMVVWANLHGSFAFGLALCFPFALEAVLANGTQWRQTARQWALFTIAAFAAALATPQFWHGLLFPFSLLQLKALRFISEWQPPDFGKLQPIAIALGVLLYAALTRGIRVPALRLLLVLGLLYLAMAHARHQMIAGIVGALILAEPLGRGFGQAGATHASADLRRTVWLIGLAAGLVLSGARLLHPVELHNDSVSPITALQHVPRTVTQEHVFNDYDFGGYLIFSGIKPFVDGRTDLYGDKFLTAYAQAQLPEPAEFRRLVDQYDIRWAMLHTNSPLANLLSVLPGWQRLYGDRVAVVYLRRN